MAQQFPVLHDNSRQQQELKSMPPAQLPDSRHGVWDCVGKVKKYLKLGDQLLQEDDPNPNHYSVLDSAKNLQ